MKTEKNSALETLSEINDLFNNGDVINAVAKLQSAIAAGIQIAPHNIHFAHRVTMSAHWETVTQLLPSRTNFFMTSGWLESIRRARPINAQKKPVPWFTYPAIDFLDRVIQKCWNVLEYGSGNSTLWWADRVRKVTAIEDNQPWFEEVQKQLPDNASIHLFEEKEDYVTGVSSLDEKYDVIVVDGSHRNECANESLGCLKDSGIIIFDNADVMIHEAGQKLLKEKGFYRIDFWGLIPSYLYKNCTSVYFKDPSILLPSSLPHEHVSSVGPSCSQALEQEM